MLSLPRIQQTIDEIRTLRIKKIRLLLQNIAKKGKQVNVQQATGANRAIIFGVSDRQEAGVDLDTWRFKTKAHNVSAMYYEKWLPYKEDIYFLDRAYFHIYKYDQSKGRPLEYICLHCDANEPDTAAHAKFKQSPHLHFSFAEDPIPHSHIALNNGNLDHILLSIDNLHTALEQAINMIDNQILDLL